MFMYVCERGSVCLCMFTGVYYGHGRRHGYGHGHGIFIKMPDDDIQ
jgi:hypothetical protein